MGSHQNSGLGSGFVYKTVPHITLKSIANNEPPATETLYDQPEIDNPLSPPQLAGISCRTAAPPG